MNEKRIQEVIEIERQAQDILNTALREAEALPRQAEQDARELIEKARLTALEEGRTLVAEAHAQSEVSQIASKAEVQVARMESLGMKNLERAVQYVLERVIGKE